MPFKTTPLRCRGSLAVLSLLLLPCVARFELAWSRPMEVPPDSPFLIDAWETDDGLPENSATSIVQTPDGYLWFGTFNGLVRFDGMRFTVYDRSTTPQLPSAAIVSLHLDRQQRLWISTDRGIARVGPDGWRAFGPDEGFTGNYVRRFAESADGQLVVVSYDGHLFRYQSERFVDLPEPPTGSPSGFTPFFDENHVLWCAGPRFLGRWHDSAWVPAAGEPWQAWGSFDSASPGRSGDLWLCLKNELLNYHDGTLHRRIQLHEPISNIWDLREDPDGTLWAASDLDGLSLVSPDGSVQRFTTANGLSYNSLRVSFADREGNVWVGSSGGGLLRFKRRHFANFGLTAGLPNRVVKSVAEFAPGVMLVGTHGGGPALLHGTRASSLPITNIPPALPYVWSVLRDPSGRTWIGTFGQGLHRIDQGRWQSFVRHQAPGTIIHALFQDSKGRIWIGGDRGIGVFSAGQFLRFGEADGLAARSIRAFAEDPISGNLWAASYDGGLWQSEGDPPRHWTRHTPLPTEQLWSLLTDPDGTLWVGTFGAGLCRIRNGKVDQFTEEQGLPARSVAALLNDDLGHLWIGSNRGIFRVDRGQLADVAEGRLQRLQAHRFNLSDGLASLECSGGYQPSACKDSSGRLWFGTLKGVVRVDPFALRLNHRPPKVVFETVVADRQTIFRSDIRTSPDPNDPSPNPILIPAGSRQIEIHYSGLSLTAPEKVRFQVRLDGLDDDWRDVGNLRVAYLTDLQPGAYSFRVRAANNDGVWNPDDFRLAFVVPAHFWQKSWFRGLGLIVLMAATGLLTRRIAHGRLRNRLEVTRQRQSLSHAQVRLASVLENTSDFVGFSDADARLLYVNAAGRRLVGLEPDAEVAHLRLADLVPDCPIWPTSPHPSQPSSHGDIWQGEGTLRHLATGHAVPVSLVLLVHRRQDGSLDYFSVIARDRSAEKRAEELLRRENAFRESIIRKAGEGICVFHLVPETPGIHFTVWNDRMTELTGFTLDDINRLGWQALVPPDPDHQARAKSRVQQASEGQDLSQDEWELRRRDGAFRVVLVSTGRLPADHPQATPQILAVLHDITGRKTAEAVTEQQRLRLSGIINSAMDAIITLDEDARIVVFNPAAETMFRCPGADVIGRPIDPLLPAPSRSRLAEAMNHLVTTTATHVSRQLETAGTLPGRRADGTEFPMEVTVSRVPLQEHSYFTLTCRDVTELQIAEAEREHLEAQLRQSQKMEAIGTLAGGIAHDFNNMLGVILGYAELARMDLGPGHPSLRCLDEVVQASQRAKRLVQQILAFSRKQATLRRPQPLEPVIVESVALLRATLPAGVSITHHLHPDAPAVLADRTQIEQVIVNLCTNAWQAMSAGIGKIEILLKPFLVTAEFSRQHPGLKSGPHALLVVADDGCGMDAATLERIFDPFFTTKAHGFGTGLGLSIVHSIIKNHDGIVTVESRPGEGTTFNVLFPAARRTDDEPELPAGQLRPGHGKRILFLDDEQALVEFARRTMEVLGYQVSAFHDPVEALNAFRREPHLFDAILTDLSMPGCSGIDIAAEARTARPGIPVILCSGHFSDQADRDAARIAPCRFLQKPYSPAELSTVINDALRESTVASPPPPSSTTAG